MNPLKVENIISEIARITNFEIDWNNRPFNCGNAVLDGTLTLSASITNYQFWGALKNSVISSTIPSIISQVNEVKINDLSFPIIVIANYISLDARLRLKENEINYIDAAGNLYLNYNSIYLFAETGKSARSEITNVTGRAFTKTGLKVVFQFLKQEVDFLELVAKDKKEFINLNSTYDMIAEVAQVSKDTVAKVMKDLLVKKYILKASENTFIWNAKTSLFEKWVIEFNNILRPKLAQQNYRLRNSDFTFEVPKTGYRFGGIEGTRRLINIPQNLDLINPNIIIYTNKEFKDIVKDYPVIPDSRGNITFMEAFWKDHSSSRYVADVSVLYADLIVEKDPRYFAIAALLRKTHIQDNER